MLDKIFKIATRTSPLALCQARFIQHRLMIYYPNLQFEILAIVTKGDSRLNSSLMQVGEKGIFIKELEIAILEKRADLAVHSMKDVPMHCPEGLSIVTICEREDPCDAFISNIYNSLDNLPQGAIVGTSSLRRQCQISAYRQDLIITSIHGNIDTRLNKLDKGEYDAIILATAGLRRLRIESRIHQIFPTDFLLPAAGQGAVGIECRQDDIELIQLLQVLNHTETSICISAERAMNNHLNSNCQIPIGSFAILKDNQLYLKGLVGSPNGKQIIVAERSGTYKEPTKLGIALAEELLDRGASFILNQNNQLISLR
ncbi:hydroxymethylbilane synthase [Pantoea sp. Mhis]|uniref:hydroxymethylbilane synthase n=1 Tax=Pantoea sp. Mhis TaxID=2576759 RepID=UPI0013569001|nr:hydroxymethylbilane synthase [Pantoea sp. Mhis]MXP56418.1 hydroxymethylbilane synthase [Pantoea sp. Mhis]